MLIFRDNDERISGEGGNSGGEGGNHGSVANTSVSQTSSWKHFASIRNKEEKKNVSRLQNVTIKKISNNNLIFLRSLGLYPLRASK